MKHTGPLNAYRFPLSVGFAALVAGGAVVDAVQQGGTGLDLALLRALGAAIVMWIPTGVVDKILQRAAVDPVADADLTD